VTEKSGELKQVATLDIVEVQLGAGLLEVGKSVRVRRQGFRLFAELGFVQEIGESRCD
jgi:hypothetical protein